MYDPFINYVRGKVYYFDNFNLDELSCIELLHAFRCHGIPVDMNIHCKLPTSSTLHDGLMVVNSHATLIDMVDRHILFDVVVLYV